MVRAAAVTYDSTRSFSAHKAFVSGNPVRPEFLATAGPQQEWATNEQTSVIRVLVFGGSQGAHAINMAMVEAAARLAADGPRIFVSPIKRENEMWRWCAPRIGRRGFSADVEPFLYDMGRRLRQADLIVSPGRRDDAGGDHGGGEGGDSRFRCRPRPTITSGRTPRRWPAPAAPRCCWRRT